MKNLLLTLLLLSLLAVSSWAQPTDYYDRMNHVFGAIDKSKVNTGLLKEFGVRLNEVGAYTGALSATNWVDVTQWQSLYHSLYTMRVGTATSMIAPASVYSHLETQQANNPGVVLLAAEYYTYNQYKTNAYANGDVTVVNDRIYDVAGRNPYDTKTAFAVAPMEYHLRGNGFAFKLQSNMIYTNSSQTLSSVQVDFDNGQGYQSISLNTVKNVVYFSDGEKELKVKFVYTGGPTLYSHSKLYIDYQAPVAQARFDGANLLFDEEPITGAAYLGASAIGDVTVELAPGHTAITKPLIVVEGFDPFDDFDYDDFIDEDGPGGINFDIDSNPTITRTLNQAIEDEGYDLIFINYRNGTDYIQRNAYMVEAVIEWVNGLKVGSEPNVVLGMSMGALVARYALRHMETTSRTHETSLYISHDAPHQGANVPLAFQGFVRHLVGESVGLPVFLSLFTIDIVDIKTLAPDLEDGLTLLQSPAAQQMLIYQLQGSGTGISVNNAPHDNFATEYKNLGYLTQGGIKNIAISNGSECGNPLDFAPYATLANVDEKIDLPFFATNLTFFLLNQLSVNPIRSLTSVLSTNTDIKAQFNMRALPSQQAKQIYKGKIFIKKKVLFVINVEEQLIGQKTLNSLSSMLPLDNSGGGIYDINQFVSLPSEFNGFLQEQRFSFIPTYSSLDIGAGSQPIVPNDLLRAYSPVSPPQPPKNTPFDNFFTNPTISENHTQFTLNNGNWLLEELQGTNAFYSCATSCGSGINLNITGAATVCDGSASFQLQNVPSGLSVNWTAGPSNLIVGATSGSGTTANLQTVTGGGGNAGVHFVVSGGCENIEIDKYFDVGIPPVPYILPTGPVTVEPNTTVNFVVPDIAPEIDWSISGRPTAYTYDVRGNGYADIYCDFTPTNPGTFTVRARANYGCGYSAYSSAEVICQENKPDLTIENLSFSSNGLSANLNFDLSNQGNAMAIFPVVGYYKSSNHLYDATDQFLSIS